MSVGNLFHAEAVQSLQIHLGFSSLEFRDGQLPVVNAQENYQLPEFSDFLFLYFATSLEVKSLTFFLGLGFEERLKSGFTRLQFIRLFLIGLERLLGHGLGFLDAFVALQAVMHTLSVQELALEPDIGLSVGVLRILEGEL